MMKKLISISEVMIALTRWVCQTLGIGKIHFTRWVFIFVLSGHDKMDDRSDKYSCLTSTQSPREGPRCC